MIDMRKDRILNEWRRLFSDMQDGYGILNIDIGVYFPYKNQDAVTCKIGLLNDTILNDEDTENDDKYLFTDVIHNHRYKNKGYVTLSKKVGRKICKTGYPIYAPIGVLNNIEMFLMKFGIRNETMMMCFPINIILTEDRPIGGFKLKIHDWEKTWDQNETKNMGFDFTTNWAERDGQYGYLVGGTQRFIVGKPSRGYQMEQDIALKPVTSGRTDLIGFTPAITIKGQPTETFFI